MRFRILHLLAAVAYFVGGPCFIVWLGSVLVGWEGHFSRLAQVLLIWPTVFLLVGVFGANFVVLGALTEALDPKND